MTLDNKFTALIYSNPQGLPEKAAPGVERKSRGFQGSLTKETDNKGIIYYKGFYTGKYRNLDVLFKSYDEATGFITKPDGTQLAIISGYEL